MRAIDSGIPVIAYNSADWRPDDERIPYMSYIGQDEYKGGYEGAKRLFEAHGGTKGVCTNQSVGQLSVELRCQGMVDALQELGVETDVLDVGQDPAVSVTIMEDYYAANPETDIWFTMGPNSADPFYQFMDNAGLKTGDVAHGTFDLGPQIQAHIEDGTTDFGIDQQPYTQGALCVQWITWNVRYGLAPQEIVATGPSFITKDNLGKVTELAGIIR